MNDANGLITDGDLVARHPVVPANVKELAVGLKGDGDALSWLMERLSPEQSQRIVAAVFDATTKEEASRVLEGHCPLGGERLQEGGACAAWPSIVWNAFSRNGEVVVAGHWQHVRELAGGLDVLEAHHHWRIA